MPSLSDVVDFIERNKDVCDIGQPATNERIENAERYLQVRFPDDYRSFLKKWGTLSIGPLEFYGTCTDDFSNSTVPDAIWLTQKVRQQFRIPNNLIVLCSNNGDEYYCLDTSSAENSPIIIWDTIQGQIRCQKAESLFEFILSEAADLT